MYDQRRSLALASRPSVSMLERWGMGVGHKACVLNKDRKAYKAYTLSQKYASPREGVGTPRNFAHRIMVNTVYHVTFLTDEIFVNKKASENRKLFKYRGLLNLLMF